MFKFSSLILWLFFSVYSLSISAQIISTPFQASNHALKFANALHFDGVNDYVDILNPVFDDFTIEYWIKTTQTGTSGGNWYNGIGIVDAEVGGSTNDFGTSLSGSKLAFGTGNSDYTIFSNASINDGSWKHIAVTRTKSTGAIAIYINGVLDQTGISSNRASLSAASYLRIGGMQTGVNYFNGALDDIRVWYVVRTQAQIAANMNQELNGNEAGLIAYFKCNQGVAGKTNTGITTLFDETVIFDSPMNNFALTSTTSNFIFGKLNTSVVTEGLLMYLDPTNRRSYLGGSTLADLSLNKNNGTLSSPAPVFNNSPKRFTFNGTSSNYININSSKLNTSYTGKTIMVVARMDANFGTGLFRALFGSSVGSRNFNFYVYHNGSNFVLHFSAGSSGTFSDVLPINTGQWIIVAATQDADTTTYYLNGVKVGVTSMPLSQYLSTTDENVCKADNYWLGDIGPVLIYKRCLSESDVMKNVNALKGNYGL